MAIKTKLHIRCPECGAIQQGRREATGYWFTPCNCKKVPGPAPLPYAEKGKQTICPRCGTKAKGVDIRKGIIMPTDKAEH
jgi:ribosomal protein L37E